MPWKKNKDGELEFKTRFKNAKLQNAIDELLGWLPSETREYQEFVCNIVGSIPGGELLADLGYNKFDNFLGWKEFDMVGKLMEAIDDKQDAEDAAEALYGPPEEEEEY